LFQVLKEFFVPNWPATNNLSGILKPVIGTFSVIPAAKVRYVLLLLTGIWFLSLLADFIWMWAPAPKPTAVVNISGGEVFSAMAGQQNQPTLDLSVMQSWHLFGSAQAVFNPADIPAEANPNDASLTNLQLVLLGVLYSDAPEDGFAIIQGSGKSDLYKVGDPIPVGDNITLAKVLVDRVIINNRGSMEALLLYTETRPMQEELPQTPVSKSVMDQRNNPELSALAGNYRNQLLSNPLSLADVIKVSIAKDAEGKLIGYRIRPGRDRAQFAQFGLQTGDVVTSINGTPLDDPAKAMELYGQLREAKEASFVVRRGDQEINLIVGLTQQ
jgi:general secretion pathway protein C